MTDNPEARVDLVALEEYWAGAERGENDGQHMPKPPNADVAWEVATLCTKSIGHLLDFKKTGVLPDFNTPPSPESQLEASALIHDQSKREGLE
jgi:hypothetical protein